jgi:HEAT repeat protein
MVASSVNDFCTILDRMDAAEPSHQLLYFRGLNEVGAEALPELAERAGKAAATPAFCQLVYESSFYYPSPAWLPVLSRMLRHESDLQMFEVGLRAISRVGGSKAVTALMELSRLRSAPEFKQAVSEMLAKADPEQAFKHHLAGLLEGSANPRVANEAASQLEDLVNESHLEALQAAIQHPDLLVFRHAIRLLARIPASAAAECLAKLLEAYHREALGDREIKELLPDFHSLSREEATQKATAQLALVREKRGLPDASGGGAPAQATGSTDDFLVRVLAALRENGPTQFSKLLTEVGEEIHLRARRLSFALDNGAMGLVQMVRSGFYPLEKALPLLEAAVRENTGREGMVRAFASLVPAEETERLDLVILHPEGAMRAIAVEALGERKEEALRPTLLKACHDSIADIALQALEHLGRLPGAESVGRELLQASTLEEIRLGIRFIGMHRMTHLAPELIALIRDGEREEITLLAAEALGHLESSEVAEALLELLHSGQSPQLQKILARSIGLQKLPGVALALCGKADELKQVEIHALAAEALCHGPQPLDTMAGQELTRQVRAAWNGKDPWPLRLRLISAFHEAMLIDKEQRRDFASLVHQTLAEKRPSNAWSPEDLAKVMGIAKDLSIL